MEKSEILKLFSDKSDRVSFVNNDKAFSSAWTSFALVNVDNVFTNFIKCLSCDVLLKWKKSYGTSGLIHHVRSCPKRKAYFQELPSITQLPGFSIVKEEPYEYDYDLFNINTNTKNEVADVIVAMCAKDILPLDIVEGPGFRFFFEKLLEVGAKLGDVNVNDLLPSSLTISRHLNQEYEKLKLKYMEEVLTVSRFGTTCDIWTSENMDGSHLIVTMHFITPNWELRDFVIGRRSINQPPNAEYIKSNVNEIVRDFHSERTNNIYITDNVENMKTAFRDKIWLSSACHNLNLVLSHGLNSSDTPSEFNLLLTSCKKLLSLARGTSLSNQMNLIYKQGVSRQWNNTYAMLELISNNIDTFKADTNLSQCAKDINLNLLKDLMEVLRPFRDATNLLTSCHVPTLHLVIPTKYKLVRNLSTLGDDTEVIKQLKRNLMMLLEQHMVIGDLHWVASLLDPRIKNSNILMSREHKEVAIKQLKKLVDEVNSVNGQTFDFEPPSKKHKISENKEDFLADLFDGDSSMKGDSEVDLYLANVEASGNILEFWKRKVALWPKLSTVAKEILAAPASSTSSKRLFSLAGLSLIDRQSTSSPRNVDQLLFINSCS